MSEPETTASHPIRRNVGRYYTDRLRQFGTTPRGVDWNSAESQELRFAQLLKVLPSNPSDDLTLLDYGCGYAALLDYLRASGVGIAYRGYDISDAMVAAARARHAETGRCAFAADDAPLAAADFVVASGIFNVKLDTSGSRWREYMLETIGQMNTLSRQGFAFNALTTYSDVDRRRPDLYYSDPCELFDFCKRRFSRQVALLHDYPLFEFTILVRK